MKFGTLADCVSSFSGFFKNSFNNVKYAVASAAGAAVIAFSPSAAAQASAPSTPAPALATASAPAQGQQTQQPDAQPQQPSAPRRHLDAQLQQSVDAFEEICSTPTRMGMLTQYSLTCEGVDEYYLRLRMKTPVGRPDKQESRRWELYKIGDLFSSFDFMPNHETKRIIAQGVADLHNSAVYQKTAVHQKNMRAPASDLIDPALIDIVSAGADGVGGSRLEVVYDVMRHKELYKTLGPTMNGRIKQRYGLNTPVWNNNEVLTLETGLLRHMNIPAIREKIRSEESRVASSVNMYGEHGTIALERIDADKVVEIFTQKNFTFDIPKGVYGIRSSGARNFMPFVDIDGNGKTDLDARFEFSPGWQGTITVRNDYTGAQRISDDVRRGIEGRQAYVIRVAPSVPTAGAPTGTEASTGTGAPAAPGTGTAPTGTGETRALPPPVPTPAAGTGTADTTTAPSSLDAEAAGMFARIGPHLNIVLEPGYGMFSLAYVFEDAKLEARSNAMGPAISGSAGGIFGEGNGVAWGLAFDYFSISNGSGTVEKRGNGVGGFTYDGSWRTIAAEVGYARLLSDHRSEPDRFARRKNLILGLRGEQSLVQVSGENVTANEQITNMLLAIAGFDIANAFLGGTDHAVRAMLGAGANNQSNTNGIDYDAGFTARIAAEYLARFDNSFGITAGAGVAYNGMGAEQRGNEQKRSEFLLSLRGGLHYFIGSDRQHRVGAGLAYTSMNADNTANGDAQVSETRNDVRALLTADFAFE